MENKKIKFKKIISVFFLSFFLTFLLADFASAGAIYFSPSSGKYRVGDSISVGVYISSSDVSSNAVSGSVSFPKDKLEVSSLSKSGSIFSLWVQEPNFSNSLGKINFEGIILNPGFKGPGGKIISINFKVKSAGNIDLSFLSASILANDGTGTNILKSMGGAKFAIEEKKIEIDVKDDKPIEVIPKKEEVIVEKEDPLPVVVEDQETKTEEDKEIKEVPSDFCPSLDLGKQCPEICPISSLDESTDSFSVYSLKKISYNIYDFIQKRYLFILLLTIVLLLLLNLLSLLILRRNLFGTSKLSKEKRVQKIYHKFFQNTDHTIKSLNKLNNEVPLSKKDLRLLNFLKELYKTDNDSDENIKPKVNKKKPK